MEFSQNRATFQQTLVYDSNYSYLEKNQKPNHYNDLTNCDYDHRGNLDPQTHTPIATYQFTAFGEQISATSTPYNPWRFAGKRVDPELNLIYYGKRYYDPDLACWLTTDPAGFHDATNLYQFLLNNPFKYYDPDGEFAQAIIIPLVIFGAGAAPTLAAVGTSLAISAAAYGAYRGVEYMVNSGITKSAALNAATGFVAGAASSVNSWIQRGGYPGGPFDVGSYYRPHNYNSMQRSKKGSVDESLPKDPFNDPNLEDVSHPKGKENGHHRFKDKRTGEIIEYDKGKPGETGHKGSDHYHRPNPNETGKGDYYLDSNGNPVPKGSEESHLYPPDQVWWDQ